MKKIISMLLTVAMILSAVPMIGFAEENEEITQEAQEVDTSKIGVEAEVGNTIYYIEDGNLLCSVDSARSKTVAEGVKWVVEDNGFVYYAKIEENNTDIYKSGDDGFQKLTRLFAPIDAFDVDGDFVYYSWNGEVDKVNTVDGTEEVVQVGDKKSFYISNNNINFFENYTDKEKREIELQNSTTNKLDAIKSVFHNFYWNANLSENDLITAINSGYLNMQNGYTLEQRRSALGITSNGCTSSSKSNGSCSSNTFGGGIQCNGFGKFLYYALYGKKVDAVSGTAITVDSLQPGDFISTGGSDHTAIVWKIEDDVLYTAECWGSYRKGSHLGCLIQWNKGYHGSYSTNSASAMLKKLKSSSSCRFCRCDSSVVSSCSNCANAWTKSFRYHGEGYCDDCKNQYKELTIDCKPFTQGVYKWNNKDKYGKKYVRSSPYEISKTIVTPAKFSEIQILGQVKNADGGRWYKVKVNGKEGYSVSYKIEADYDWKGNLPGDLSLKKDGNNALKFPKGDFKKGSNFGLRGEIVSGGANIDTVTGNIVKVNGDTCTVVQTATNKVNKTTYNIQAGVNNNLLFNKLNEGVYYVVYHVEDQNGYQRSFSSLENYEGYDGDYFRVGNVGIPPVINVSDVSGGKQVKLSCSNGSATIYYTLDGGAQKSISNNGSITVKNSGNHTVKAWTVLNGVKSEEITRSVDIQKAPKPSIWDVIKSKLGLKAVDIDVDYSDKCAYVTISGEGDIYYTMDGSTPTENSPRYTDPVPITESKTVKAISVMSGYAASDIEEKDIIIKEPDPPTISLYNTKDKIAQGKTATVSWEPVKYATSYKAYLYLDGKEVDTYTTTGTKASFALSKRSDTENFSYSIKVVATNFVGDSEFSNTVNVMAMHPLKVTFVDRINRTGDLTEDKLNEVKRRLDNRLYEGAGTNLEGNVISVQKVDYDEKPSKPATPAKTGFTFSGWSSGLYEVTLVDKTVYGEFDINYYNVAFYDIDDFNVRGKLLDSKKYMYTDEAITPENYEVPSSYVFCGWSIDNSKSTGFDLTFIDGNIVADAIYGWANEDLPVEATISKIVRDDKSYTITVGVKNNPVKDTQGRIVAALYTSEGRNLYTQISEKDLDLGHLRDKNEYFTITLLYDKKIDYAKVFVVATKNDKTGGALSEANESHDITYTEDYQGWSNWSDFKLAGELTTEEITPTSTRQVKTATQYRYRDKQFTTTNNTKTKSGWNYSGTSSSVGC